MPARVPRAYGRDFGLERDLSREPHAIVLPLTDPVAIAGESRDRLYVEPFGFDPSLATQCGSPLKVCWPRVTDVGTLWPEIRMPIARGRHGSLRLSLVCPEPRFPGLKDRIEAAVVATPMTTLRFTVNGTPYQNPINIVAALFTGRRFSKTLPRGGPGCRLFRSPPVWVGTPRV